MRSIYDSTMEVITGFSKSIGGVEVEAYHGSSEGFVPDLTTISAVKGGCFSKAVASALEGIRESIAALPPGWIHHIFAHSRG